MALSLLKEPEARAQSNLLLFPAPRTAEAAAVPNIPVPQRRAQEPAKREPRHSALLLIALALLALVLYFSAALV